jgi:uncharacterized protein (TIGR02996 family)
VTHDDAFLQDILANPLDDAPRLIYADYLEHTGWPERGEFIRAGVELARTGMRECPTPVRRPSWVSDAWQTVRCGRCRFCRPMFRARALMDAGDHTAAFPFPFACTVESSGPSPDVPVPVLRFRRGFVESVTLSADAFLEHAAALFAAAPILEVTLAGKEPGHRTDGLDTWLWGPFVHWYDAPEADTPHRIPDYLWHALRGPEGWTNHFPTREEALAALSRACVAYGRERAGLPALPAGDH